MKSWLQDDDIEMYSTNNEEKSLLLKDLLEPLKIKSLKYITSLSKNVYIDKLDDTIDE